MPQIKITLPHCLSVPKVRFLKRRCREYMGDVDNNIIEFDSGNLLLITHVEPNNYILAPLSIYLFDYIAKKDYKVGDLK